MDQLKQGIGLIQKPQICQYINAAFKKILELSTGHNVSNQKIFYSKFISQV